jgi:hypothetical protein
MMAFETPDGPEVVRLKVCRATVYLPRVLLQPWTGDVVLVLAKWRLVKTTVLERDQDSIFLRRRYPHRIAVGRPLLGWTSFLPPGSAWHSHL